MYFFFYFFVFDQAAIELSMYEVCLKYVILTFCPEASLHTYQVQNTYLTHILLSRLSLLYDTATARLKGPFQSLVIYSQR